MTYAKGTQVPISRSQQEIEATLKRYGAESFASGWDNKTRMAFVQFSLRDRVMRYIIHAPERSEFEETPTGLLRADDVIEREWEKGVRQRWRALKLIILAKLEAVESGIVTFEEEFLPHFVLPGGETVGDKIMPQIESVLETGEIPPMLPAGRADG